VEVLNLQELLDVAEVRHVVPPHRRAELQDVPLDGLDERHVWQPLLGAVHAVL
jgi:hypothetical protein